MGLENTVFKDVIDVMLETFYPVGAIYMNTVDDTDPSYRFRGTTWQKIEDRMLMASGIDFTIGETGGAKDKILSIAEMPSHGHTISINSSGNHRHGIYSSKRGVFGAWSAGGGSLINGGGSTATGYGNNTLSYGEYAGDHTHGASASNVGSGDSFSLMNPYKVVSMWERIA